MSNLGLDRQLVPCQAGLQYQERRLRDRPLQRVTLCFTQRIAIQMLGTAVIRGRSFSLNDHRTMLPSSREEGLLVP